MDQIIIATAGHVDHGKTTLIKTLTGVDTDTTKEEKTRGLTINLGFTFFKLPNDQRVGIVDVPGHEKFLKNMLAGLSGVDIVLLVVDVNEGVMPQTLEHANIMRLIGITNFIIVLTKVETVDPEIVALAVEDVRETFQNDLILARAPIIRTDAISGYGISQLISTIQATIPNVHDHKNTGFARLNIDRDFVVKGFGTVVTGTLLEGNIHSGEDLVIYPSKQITHVKSVRTYDYETEIALPGQRTALNINIPNDQITRGNVLAVKDSVQVTKEVNVILKTLKLNNQDLELNTRVRFYVGATEVMGRIYPLGDDKINSESNNFAQIRLESSISIKYGDYFIIRSYSPIKTLGGGKILETHPFTRKRYDNSTLETLKIRAQGDLATIISDYCYKNMIYYINEQNFQLLFNESIKTIQKALNKLINSQQLFEFKDMLIVLQVVEKCSQQLINKLQKYHKNFPLRRGIPGAELKSKLSTQIGTTESEIILSYMEYKRYLQLTHGYYHLYDFCPHLSTEDKNIKTMIENELQKAGNTPPTIDKLLENKPNGQEILASMIGDSVVLLDNTTVIDTNIYQKLITQVQNFINQNGSLSLADYRDLTGSSRKYAMMILEKMDKDGITERLDNKRILKKTE